jgi:DNA-binding MarR family transcriptional regulator
MEDLEKIRYLILAAQREGERSLTASLKALNITPSQAEALRVIQVDQPLSLKQLGERLICETGSPSRLTATLIGKGLIRAERSQKDKRMVMLTLTQRGSTIAGGIDDLEHFFYQELSKRVQGQPSEHIIDFLAAILGESLSSRALELRGYIPVKDNERND